MNVCDCAWRKGKVFKDGRMICASCGVPLAEEPPTRMTEEQRRYLEAQLKQPESSSDGYGWEV